MTTLQVYKKQNAQLSTAKVKLGFFLLFNFVLLNVSGTELFLWSDILNASQSKTCTYGCHEKISSVKVNINTCVVVVVV